jgi:hypothetical protein
VKLVEDVRRVCGPLTDTCGHSRTLDPKSWTVAGHSRSVGGHSRTLAENCSVRGCVEITGNSGGEVVGVAATTIKGVLIRTPTPPIPDLAVMRKHLCCLLRSVVLPRFLLRPLAPRDDRLYLFGLVILWCILLQPSRPVRGTGAPQIKVIIITLILGLLRLPIPAMLPKRRALDGVRPGA